MKYIAKCSCGFEDRFESLLKAEDFIRKEIELLQNQQGIDMTKHVYSVEEQVEA